MDEYYISNIPERFLMTQHYQSSMQQPNLDNVEAKLQVARQRNHQLAMQYFRNKYGSAAAYQDFARKHNMGEVIDTQPSPEQLLVRHLERKAKQIQHKVYGQQEYETNNQYEKHPNQPEWVRKQSKRPSNNNPWVKQVKASQKPQNNDLGPALKYVDSLIAPKSKQSQFISQFKNYLDNKQKLKEQQKVKQSETNFNKTSESKLFSPSKINNKSISISQVGTEKKKCYEEELGKKIFKDIVGECKDETKIEKLALVEHLVKNKKLLKVLGLTEAELNDKILREEPTKSESQMSQQQFVYFILKTVGKQKQINQLKQQKRSKNVPEGCMLSKETILHFEKIFKQLDTHTDLIIKRLPYIDRLANDPYIKNMLNSPAVFEPEINKSISLRRIFERIQMECMFGGEEQQKIKQYISWNEFLDYFKSGYSPQVLYNMVSLIDTLHKSDAMGLVEVPQIAMEIITQVISKVPCKSGYFNTLALIQAIIRHPEYQHEKYTEVRQQSKIAGLPSQAFQEVLARIKQTGDKFMTLKEFLEYFSNKGRPVQQFEQAKINSARKNFSGVKVKFAAEELAFKEQDNIDGYDSDPQIYQSKVMNKNSAKKSGRSAKKLQHAVSFIQQNKSRPSNKRQFKVTVPAPFGFQEREKQRNKNKLENITEHVEEQQAHFKAKPIPPKVLEEGLYYKMLEDQRKKIQERRKGCMIMTLANQQPFSFLNRKTNKKTKQQRQQFIFKAKPIPWYCSVDLLQKKKQAEILRNQKIAKEAQQNLAKAKLPPRMERDFQQKQAKLAMTEHQKLNRPDSKPKVYRQPPDFHKLHRQFEQGLQRKRKQNKTTKPQQFNFNHKSRPKTGFPHKTQQQFIIDQQNKQKLDYKRLLESKPLAASTAKYEQQVEKRRQEMDKKRKEEEVKKKQDEERKKIDQDLKSKLMAAVKTKQYKQQQQKQKRSKLMAEEMKSFQEWKKNCIQKGRNQPMLVNRPLKRDEKIQKMKKLYQISQTLKGNGIKGKDHDSYFNRQELLMLQDWQQLKDKLQ